MTDDTLILLDYAGREVRLTVERQNHILEHPEMTDQLDRIRETVGAPETVVQTQADNSIQVYHRYYEATPVTSKFLLVVVKLLADGAFVLTAFFSPREKKGEIIWKA